MTFFNATVPYASACQAYQATDKKLASYVHIFSYSRMQPIKMNKLFHCVSGDEHMGGFHVCFRYRNIDGQAQVIRKFENTL